MSKSLLILEEISDYEQLIRDIDINSFEIFAATDEAEAFLIKQGAKFFRESDFRNKAVYGNYFDKAFLLSRLWYQTENGKDITEIDGISYGFIVEKEMTYHLIGFLRNFYLASAILMHIKPNKIIVFAPNEEPLSNPQQIRGYSGERIFSKVTMAIAQKNEIFVEVKNNINSHSNKKHVASLSFKMRAKDIVNSILCRIKASKYLGGLNSFRKGILFSASFRLVKPLINECNKRNISAFLLLENFPFRNFRFFKKNKIGFRVLFDESHIEPNSEFHFDGLGGNPEWTVDGVNIFPLLKKRLDYFKDVYFRELIQLHFYCKKILTDYSVKSLVVDEDVSERNRLLVMTARQFGIPSLVLQHGFAAKKTGFYPVAASYVTVWGDLHKKRFESWGIQSSKIRVTGCPQYDQWDAIQPLNAQSKSELKNNLGLDPKKKLAVYFNTNFRPSWKKDRIETSFSAEDLKKILEGVLNAFKDLEGWELVIKLHPRDRFPQYAQEIVQRSGLAKVKILQMHPSNKLIQLSDVVLLPGWSTASLEAITLKKPVIRFNLDGRDDICRFEDYRVGVLVKDVSQIVSAVRAADGLNHSNHFDEGRRQILHDLLMDLDGKATQRVVDLCQEMMSKNEAQSPIYR